MLAVELPFDRSAFHFGKLTGIEVGNHVASWHQIEHSGAGSPCLRTWPRSGPKLLGHSRTSAPPAAGCVTPVFARTPVLQGGEYVNDPHNSKKWVSSLLKYIPYVVADNLVLPNTELLLQFQ
jgi:hypothetical protein